MQFIGDIKTNPELIYPKITTLYKTVVIKNIGILDFPSNAFLVCVDDSNTPKV